MTFTKDNVGTSPTIWFCFILMTHLLAFWSMPLNSRTYQCPKGILCWQSKKQLKIWHGHSTFLFWSSLSWILSSLLQVDRDNLKTLWYWNLPDLAYLGNWPLCSTWIHEFWSFIIIIIISSLTFLFFQYN